VRVLHTSFLSDQIRSGSMSAIGDILTQPDVSVEHYYAPETELLWKKEDKFSVRSPSFLGFVEQN
jgi:hypothetical protein